MNAERQLLDRALAGDSAAARELVGTVIPVVQVRVARVLARRRGGSARDVRQEVADLTQEVFAALFEHDARVLRAWDPARGLSLASFCGLVAEREAASILRSGRRSPWKEDATAAEDLERDAGAAVDAERGVSSREQLERIAERLREELSPRGLELFQRLVVEEEPVETVCKSTGMTPDAVYAWRSRIGKLARKSRSSSARVSRASTRTSVRKRNVTAYEMDMRGQSMTEDDILSQIGKHARGTQKDDARFERVARGEADAAELAELERAAKDDPELAARLAASRPLEPALIDQIATRSVAPKAKPAVVRAAIAKPLPSPWKRRITLAAGPLALAAAMIVYVTTQMGPSGPELPAYSVSAVGDGRCAGRPIRRLGCASRRRRTARRASRWCCGRRLRRRRRSLPSHSRRTPARRSRRRSRRWFRSPRREPCG